MCISVLKLETFLYKNSQVSGTEITELLNHSKCCAEIQRK